MTNNTISNSTITINRNTQNEPISASSNTLQHNNDDTLRDDNNDRSSDNGISLDELLYSSSSYHAIVTPVTITMILSALAVIYINTPDSKEDRETQINKFYTVLSVSDENSNAKNFGNSLINGAIIISVIAAMTFLIVILYKFRCMKLLLGYMIFSSAALLGVLGGLMLETFLDKYQIPMDKLSYFFFLYNFAIVGTISIFYQKGIPLYITQSYLIITSVILAWQLSHFQDWTAWTLLVLLALYDLCAVLTPCGPLKALVKLMSNDDAPSMPGLLYEANLPTGVKRPTANNDSNQSTNLHSSTNSSTNTSNDQNQTRPRRHETNSNLIGSTNNENESTLQQRQFTPTNQTLRISDPPLLVQSDSDETEIVLEETTTSDNSGSYLTYPLPESDTEEGTTSPTGTIPFAIARLYQLEIVSPKLYVEKQKSEYSRFVNYKYQDETTTWGNFISQVGEYSSHELRYPVVVQFSIGGGRIKERSDEESKKYKTKNHTKNQNAVRYVVTDRHGVVRRVLFVDQDGKVMQEVERTSNEKDETESNSSIKLGLGDFIFYSVLVSKAAQYSFTTFAACMLVILAGLGGTLILLSVYHHALPALPISIFLGVTFYFVTRSLIEPWIETLLLIPCYV